MKKPLMLGRIFRAYIQEQIDYDTFLKLSTALDRVAISSIPGLSMFYQEYDGSDLNTPMDLETVDSGTIQDLIIAGLVDIRFMPGSIITELDNGAVFGATQLGVLFVEIAVPVSKKNSPP